MQQAHDTAKEIASQAMRAAPAITAASMSESLDVWIKVATLIYILSQIAWLAYRANKARKAEALPVDGGGD